MRWGKPAAEKPHRPDVPLNGAFPGTLSHFDAKMTGIGINRKAKLLGMDAPGKSEDVSPQSLRQALRRFSATQVTKRIALYQS